MGGIVARMGGWESLTPMKRTVSRIISQRMASSSSSSSSFSLSSLLLLLPHLGTEGRDALSHQALRAHSQADLLRDGGPGNEDDAGEEDGVGEDAGGVDEEAVEDPEAAGEDERERQEDRRRVQAVEREPNHQPGPHLPRLCRACASSDGRGADVVDGELEGGDERVEEAEDEGGEGDGLALGDADLVVLPVLALDAEDGGLDIPAEVDDEDDGDGWETDISSHKREEGG
eukprot:758166-Hanusia_phi.AAC.3